LRRRPASFGIFHNCCPDEGQDKMYIIYMVKGKGKVHPITGLEDPRGVVEV
jgi:hypothetical protein